MSSSDDRDSDMPAAITGSKRPAAPAAGGNKYEDVPAPVAKRRTRFRELEPTAPEDDPGDAIDEEVPGSGRADVEVGGGHWLQCRKLLQQSPFSGGGPWMKERE